MTTLTRQRLFCALDTASLAAAQAQARLLRDAVGGLKVGLEFFAAEGPAGVRALADHGLPIFLDLKLHDIPNTVARAVAVLTPLSPFMLTVHAAGGPHMLRAAREAAAEAAAAAGVRRPLIIAVTVLTSLDEGDLTAVGVGDAPHAQVLRLAKLARDCGLDGVVSSAHEIAPLRQALGPDFVLVTPGIRPAGVAAGDQKRVTSPAEAVALGASFLVIGRPITEAADPKAAAEAIVAEMTEAESLTL